MQIYSIAELRGESIQLSPEILHTAVLTCNAWKHCLDCNHFRQYKPIMIHNSFDNRHTLMKLMYTV